jgi:hypothetical protein
VSSFAHAFRRKFFHERVVPEAAASARSKSAPPRPIPPVGHRIGEAEDRSPARRIALVALLIAAGVLAVFNSEGMVSTARDLAESRVGRSMLPVAERWDGAMEQIGAKRLVASVRGLMLDMQYARWADVAALFGAGNDPMAAERPEGEALYSRALPEEER